SNERRRRFAERVYSEAIAPPVQPNSASSCATVAPLFRCGGSRNLADTVLRAGDTGLAAGITE
ncbi:MAG: hypothetical protein WCB23_18885, partial [Pseudolabrys sp.]